MKGLLYHKCLLTVLKRRHNVNYGTLVNDLSQISNGVRTKVAVPFRAKNVPSERSEYSHPDIAILYTILSYYYNGLTLNEFERVIKHRLIEKYYNKWIQEIEKEIEEEKQEDIEDLPENWRSVNTADYIIKQILYKTFNYYT